MRLRIESWEMRLWGHRVFLFERICCCKQGVKKEVPSLIRRVGQQDALYSRRCPICLGSPCLRG